MSGTANGMIRYSTPAGTVGLIVRNGIVVEAPPYARSWALNRTFEELWRSLAGQRSGKIKLDWMPDE